MSIEDLSNVVFTEWTSNRNTDRTRRICLPKVYHDFQANQCVENFTCIFPPFEPITFHFEQFEDAKYIQWRRNAWREPDMAVDQMKTKRRFFVGKHAASSCHHRFGMTWTSTNNWHFHRNVRKDRLANFEFVAYFGPHFLRWTQDKISVYKLVSQKSQFSSRTEISWIPTLSLELHSNDY